MARAAEESGFAGLAVMDHPLQIRRSAAPGPLPEAFTTFGFLAGVTDRLQLGALVTPVNFRSAPLVAKCIRVKNPFIHRLCTTMWRNRLPDAIVFWLPVNAG
ncbi:MAG: LLM class flavin-dependent oxidoreductase [Actinomycetota bacterium]|nr:LLM class flavin-dependent oxidoreductase [Actinomycetota bacterium]